MTNQNQTNDDFQPIPTGRERTRVLEGLVSGTVFTAQTDDGVRFMFKLRELQGEKLLLTATAPPPRRLTIGEHLQVLFGLADGQYMLKTAIETGDANGIVVPFGSDIYRLQRRNNFRAFVPAHKRIVFKVKRIAGRLLAKDLEFELMDLSVGGMRLRWPTSYTVKPRPMDSMEGELQLPGGKTLELNGVIRNVFPPEGSNAPVGLEFQELARDDEQSLLFACMQLYRQRSYAE